MKRVAFDIIGGQSLSNSVHTRQSANLDNRVLRLKTMALTKRTFLHSVHGSTLLSDYKLKHEEAKKSLI